MRLQRPSPWLYKLSTSQWSVSSSSSHTEHWSITVEICGDTIWHLDNWRQHSTRSSYQPLHCTQQLSTWDHLLLTPTGEGKVEERYKLITCTCLILLQACGFQSSIHLQTLRSRMFLFLAFSSGWLLTPVACCAGDMFTLAAQISQHSSGRVKIRF